MIFRRIRRGLPAFLIPVVIVGYALYSMRIMPSFVGFIDHAVFVLVCYMIFDLLLEIRNDALRIAATFFFTLAISFFFLGNSLYYNFFNTWGQLDTLKQWNDLPNLFDGFLFLTTAPDFIFHFLIPLLLWQFSLRSASPHSLRTKSVAIVAILLVFSVHHAMAGPTMAYMENNPFFYMVRQKTLSMSLKGNGKMAVRVSKELAKFQPINATLYERSQSDDYPLLKKAKQNPPALSFAVGGKPNVILIVVESLRAFEMGAYGANPSYTPELDKIAREGMLFKNYYSVANQTIRAEFSILASFNPDALGGPVYVNNPDLSVELLPRIFQEEGYSTHWLEADCGSYVQRKINFLKTRGYEQFHKEIPKKREPLGLGAADEDTFDYAFDLFSRQTKPFFAEIMTLSNHWTWNYNYPTRSLTPPAKGPPMYVDYTHGVYYSDKAIGHFIDKIRNSPLLQNTLVVITGDHGVSYYPDRVPADNHVWRREIMYRSPLIVWSPKKIKPRSFSVLGCHLDLGPSLLDLLNIHKDNSFVGTSLFRNDTGPRSVVMIQDGRWNTRRENEYLYDSGPEIYLNTPPFNLKGHLRQIQGREMTHMGFRSDKDLLQTWRGESVTILEPDVSRPLENWTNSAIAAYHAIISKNRIFPPLKNMLEKTPATD